MRTILCYGDSLTWGYDPSDGTRYAFEERWPGIQKLLEPHL
jgi:lysophospholipase L1-like esterase